jgi:Ca2+-binding RTX toxin-like protein
MATKSGTTGNDTIWGTRWNDYLYGDRGNDYINGQAGNDRILGGAGQDKLDGREGDDALAGGDGVDAVFGGAGRDLLYGDGGNDYMDGGAGNDWLSGGQGDDRVRGGAGNDTIDLGSGNDDARGGSGNDTISYEVGGLVTEGRSIYYGDSGTDTLFVHTHGVTIQDTQGGIVPATISISVDADGKGGTFGFSDGLISAWTEVARFTGIEKFSATAGDSPLDFVGGALNATVTGSDGDDTFVGGVGAETFIGGEGRDEYFIGRTNSETDRIFSFNAADDVILTDWEDSQGTPIADPNIVEAGGKTIVSTFSLEGDLQHVLEIDAVGIPAAAFQSAINWDGFA